MEMVISDQKQKFGKSKKRVKPEKKNTKNIEVMNYIHIYIESGTCLFKTVAMIIVQLWLYIAHIKNL